VLGLFVLVPVVALVVAVVFWLTNDPVLSAAPDGPPPPPEFTVPFLDVAPDSAVPTAPQPAPASVPGHADPQTLWLARVSGHTDIPTRVLKAYVNAAAVTAQRVPACHLTWATLAGIGRIESDHGQHDGDQVDTNGEEATPIVGPALDGSPGVQRIPDTDKGVLDGDPVWDHAVGPMQFLPTRWRTLGLRANGDGKPADPQNIDDAALTAANYLCSYGGDLAVPKDWWAAAYRYNNSIAYGRQVFSAADAYAKASLPPAVSTPTSGPGH
jgi:membrane-bound lytic murein transglycosylase B